MFSFSFPASFVRDASGRITVAFVDFPEALTDGSDSREAHTEAIDCLASAIAFRIEGHEDIPIPSAPKHRQTLVPVPLWIAGKLALYLTMRERQTSNSELARQLGVGETAIRRMLDPNHATRTETIERALERLGKRMLVSLEDAA